MNEAFWGSHSICMVSGACLRGGDDAERSYGRLNRENESNEQPRKGAQRRVLEQWCLMWNIKLLPTWCFDNSIFSAKPWEMKKVLNPWMGKIWQHAQEPLDWLEVLGNWVGCERRQVIGGDCFSFSQPQTFENIGDVAGFPTILWDGSMHYFIWKIRKRRILEGGVLGAGGTFGSYY